MLVEDPAVFGGQAKNGVFSSQNDRGHSGVHIAVHQCLVVQFPPILYMWLVMY